MPTDISDVNNFSSEENELWQRVLELWSLSKHRDKSQIRSTLHPQYVGWDMSTSSPHDREAAVNSVTDDSPILGDYSLYPLSVHVYDSHVGVVHYRYSATILPKDSHELHITGKWSEVYLKQNGEWQMISVSGKPDN